jgi:outer membrane protein OmpA-like peptidoglycan-associated protein
MTQKMNIRTIVAAGFVLAMVNVLAACGSTVAGSASNDDETQAPCGCSPRSCTTTAKPHVTADTPTVAILGQTGSKLVSYKQDIDMVVSTAATEKAHIIVNGVSGDDSAPDLLSNVVLSGEGNNNLERTQDLKQKTASVDCAISTLQQGTSSRRPNAFEAISTLASNLDKDPSKQPVDVVLLTPLGAAAGGVDLRKPGTLDDPVAAINTLARKGLIPTCTNYRFYGLSPDAGLSDVEAAKLREFWQLYAKKCGGEFVAWEPHLATFPVTSAITPVDYSQMMVKTTPETLTATLGSDVLFGADSATLQATATTALNELKGLATQYTGKIVITGYVNPVAPGTNSRGDRELSKERAAAVASWLVSADIAKVRIATIGKGTADAVYPNPKTDAQRSANRRVVAVIYSREG